VLVQGNDRKLFFKTIDLEKDHLTAVKFREDSFIASFGNANQFFESDGDGPLRYLEWLKAKIAHHPRFALHVWQEDKIIGQLELSKLRADPSVGYVNLYYLVADKRGTGVAEQLDQYTTDLFRELGFKKMRLSVSPSNFRAINFYEKMGWTSLGPREAQPEVFFMEKLISS
jgi:RimJ/RimL family protein N-acetyltransferase